MDGFPLTRDRIQVWRIDLRAVPPGGLEAHLDEAERCRAARFAFSGDRDEFVTVRGWLRRLLGAQLGLAAGAVRFAYGSHGKPALPPGAGQGDLGFNVSHSRGMALIALGLGRELGVDVEQIRPLEESEEVAERIFTEEELRQVRTAGPLERPAVFYRLWTAKESCVKVHGGGLSLPLQEFSIQRGDRPEVWMVRAARGLEVPATGRWIPMPGGYVGAVAANRPGWELRVLDLPPSPGGVE